MTKMGRPKLDEIKDHIVTVRMSDEEYEKLREYAEVHQQTMTQIIKRGVSLVYSLP